MDKETISAQKITDEWHKHADFFELETSGSTGKPKKIKLWRNLLVYSAQTTGDELGITKNDHIYCCLPLNRAGGFMQVIRAACWSIAIDVAAPTANPMKDYHGNATLISLTPAQFYEIVHDAESAEKLQSFRLVLIGGGMLNNELQQKAKQLSCRVFETYGMTETYSHIALREVGKDSYFQPIGDVQLKLDERGCLAICGSITEQKWLQTNDMAELMEDGLILNGRWDNIINSGGIKIQPEKVERIIYQQLLLPAESIMAAGVADEKYGYKLVLLYRKHALVTAPNLNEILFKNKHETPKDCIPMEDFVFSNGKINRAATLEKLKIEQGLL